MPDKAANNSNMDKQEPIAIVGAACRFSGDVSNLGSLWDMVSSSKTGHCEVPQDRWDANQYYHPDTDRKGGVSTKHGYFLKSDVSKFDAPFFSITAKEAAAMDPMKRMLLEVVYEGIENAGILIESLMNSHTGCYVGCMTNDYEMMSLNDMYDQGHAVATGNSEAIIANRVSWFFGLKGPSLTLDTACSSSLYALHLACQSIRLGETNASIVAGVNLLLNPNTFHQLNAMHMLSKDGISHTFDDRANGYGRGEGIGCLIVKRLSDALRDGDTIRAVIRGTGANADGKTPSITQPSSQAQAELINSTYLAAGLSQLNTEYFETHGTGTPVGDPIELTAVGNTIGAKRKAAGLSPLYVGSVKPNVGHTEGCSGLAGIFKAILCLEKGHLVPTHDVKWLNSTLKMENWHLALPGLMKWPGRGLRRISVNSFGFGGANAHVILDDAHSYLSSRGIVGNTNTTIYEDSCDSDSAISTATHTSLVDTHPQVKRLYTFSTKDQAGIERLAASYVTAFEKTYACIEEPVYLRDLAYTLSERRTHFDSRSFAVASNIADLISTLSKGLPKMKRSQKQGNNMIFVCTGQGAQWPAMGRQLLSNPVFEASMRQSQKHLTDYGCKWSVFNELFKTTESNINLPEYSQTLCSVLQLALVDLLRHWNVTPKATVGHSSGEIAAAYAAGLITHADAIKIAYVRGISSGSIIRQGRMMAAGLSRDEAQEYLAKVSQGSAVVACVNSPSSVTLSGDVEAIEQLEKMIARDGRFVRQLKVNTAYHSPHMKEVSNFYFNMMGTIKPILSNTKNETVMYSSLTGRIVDSPASLDARYWVSNMEQTVEFSAAFTELLKHTTQATGSRGNTPIKWGSILELGPHEALKGPVQQIITVSGNKYAKDAEYMSLVLRNKDAMDTALATAGRLWALGYEINIASVNTYQNSETRCKVLADLPTYPWNHGKGFWHESFISRSDRFPKAPRTELLGVPMPLQNPFQPEWRNHLRITECPWIEDHIITGTVLYPGAGMLIMALEGTLQLSDANRKLQGFAYTNVNFMRGLVVPPPDERAVETRLSLLPSNTDKNRFHFTIYSTTVGNSWTRHCYGEIQLVYKSETTSEIEESQFDADWAQRSAFYEQLKLDDSVESIDTENFYEQLDSIGMQYGPLFRNTVELNVVPGQHAAHATVVIPDTISVMPENFEYPHVIHPATMDALFHMLFATFNEGKPIEESAVPYHIESMYVAKEQLQGAGSLFRGYGKQIKKSRDGRKVVCDLTISDESFSAPKVTVTGFVIRQVTAAEKTDFDSTGGPEAIKKCAHLKWTRDLAFIDATTIARLGVVGLIDCVAHKKKLREFLIVLDEESETTLEVLLHALALTNRQPGIKNLTATATYDAGISVLQSVLPTEIVKPWNAGEIPVAKSAYDAVLVLGDRSMGTQFMAKIQKTITNSGHVIVARKSGSEIDAAAMFKGTRLDRIVEVSNIVMGTASVPNSAKDPSGVYLVVPSNLSPKITALIAALTQTLSSTGITVSTTMLTPDSMAHLPGKYIISLLEAESPLIYSWNEEQFQTFKFLVSSAKHMLWLTHGGVLEEWAGGPEFAPAQGLLRVLRNENPSTTLPHFDLSADFDISDAKSVEQIAAVWRASLVEGAEMEYAELNGVIHVPRAVSDTGFDGELALASGTKKPILGELYSTPRRLSSQKYQGNYLWVEDQEARLPLGVSEVEVEVDYVGLNPNDLTGDHVGCEAVGIVSRLGENVKSVSLGQSVVVLGSNLCRTHLRQDESLVAALRTVVSPQEIAPWEFATLPAAFTTSQYSLLEVAGLARGQTVLIHSAASAFGQAALQIAQFVGAQVFALVESKKEKDVLVRHHGIPPARIFDSSLLSFVDAIKEDTNGAGIDVIFRTGNSKAILPSVATLAEFGYFLDLSDGDADVQQVNLPASKRNVSLVRIDMDGVAQKRPSVIKSLFQRIFRVFSRCGAIRTISPTSIFSVTDMAEAMKALKTQKLGKVVLSLTKDAMVLTPAPSVAELDLDANASYVLAGGLGALGLEIAHMMVGLGAKHLVFLSRSGGSNNEKDLAELRARGVQADAIKCDINDKEAVTAVFTQLKSDGRTVKGCIQCAMVLRDGHFETMTHEAWKGAIYPKTHGSKNLLGCLDLTRKPFFVLLSSITGIIGNTAQANYASGNTFEDALAHYSRKHLGIPTTSIDVGLVLDSSHFTSNGGFGSIDKYLKRYAHGWVGLQTSLEELKSILKATIRGFTADGQVVPAQVVLGLGDELIRENGVDGFQQDHKFELRAVETSTGSEGDQQNTAELLKKATTIAIAQAAIEENIKAQLAVAIGVKIEEIDSQKPLFDFGVDSLQAIEIRNRALREMQADISVFELLSATPLADLAETIASRSALVRVVD